MTTGIAWSTRSRCTNKASSPRQSLIAYLVIRQLAPRTGQSYTDWIIQWSRFHNRPPADLGNIEISSWLLHLIGQRKLSASASRRDPSH